MIDIFNVKEENVSIHQVFSKHSCFCSIIRRQGKESDASKKQTSKDMICEMPADEDKGSGGLMEGNEQMQAEMKLTSLKEVSVCT